MEARFDLLPDAALALAAIYLILFAGVEGAACPNVLRNAQSESEVILRLENPELAQNSFDLHIAWQRGGVCYRLQGEEYADVESLGRALAKIVAAGEYKAVRISAEPAVPQRAVADIVRLCADMGVTPFFPLPDNKP